LTDFWRCFTSMWLHNKTMVNKKTAGTFVWLWRRNIFVVKRRNINMSIMLNTERKNGIQSTNIPILRICANISSKKINSKFSCLLLVIPFPPETHCSRWNEVQTIRDSLTVQWMKKRNPKTHAVDPCRGPLLLNELNQTLIAHFYHAYDA